MKKPQKPAELDAPGLKWKARRGAWVAYWEARTDIAGRGYKTPCVRLWAGAEPSPDEWTTIASACAVQQVRMLAWAGKDGSVAVSPEFDPRSLYDGTLGSLIDVYRRDPDSPYQELRWHTRTRYDLVLTPLKAAVVRRACRRSTSATLSGGTTDSLDRRSRMVRDAGRAAIPS